jgi:translocation and assembly module TamB
VALAAAGVRLEGVGDRPFTSPRLEVSAEIPDDLSAVELGSAEASVDGVSLVARGRIRDLCAPQLELDVTGGGPLRDVIALARIREDAPADGTATTVARVAGPARHPDISGTIRFERARVGWFRPREGRAAVRVSPELDALIVDRVEWPVPGGRAVARGRVGFQRHVPMEWEVETQSADLADVLESVGIEGSWVTVRLDGKGRLAGTVVPLLLEGAFDGDFRDLRTYARAWKTVKPGAAPVLEVRRGRIETPIRITDEAIVFEGARASSGRGTSVVDAVTRLSDAGGYEVRWRGQVDLDALGAVAGIPLGGLADVDATLGAAPYGNPRAVGRARAEGFRFLDVALGNGSCEFDYGPDFLLRIREAEGAFRQARWRGEGLVDLEPSPAQVRWSSLEAKGRVRDLFDAVQDWLPRTRPFRELVEGEVELSGTARGPAGALDGTFDARMASGTVRGRPFDSARVAGTFVRGEEARYERAELRRGPGVVRMTGRSGFDPPFPWDLEVSFAGVSLGDLGLPGDGWTGSASGTANLRGSLERPDVRFAANGDGVAVRGMPLGTLQLAGTAVEERLVVTGTADGLGFEAEAALAGRLPFRARADLALADVARLVPGGAASGLQARLRGEVTAEGELAALDDARVRVRVDEVQATHAEFKVRSAAPVVVTAARGRVELQPLTLVGPNTELTLSGSRAPSGQLDLSAGGTLDLRLLAGMIPDLRRPHGQLAVVAHVTGTVEEPVLVGSGRLEDAGFQLKSTPVLFAELRGDLAFSQNRVLFEDLSAAVNGGRAKLRGELELASFVPARLRVEASLDEVPLAVPAWLPATVSGRVEASGTPDEAIVTGRLHVVRARYTADVALERSLLELRRRAPAPPRAYDKEGEWLRLDVQVVVDGDARVENDLVSGALRGEVTVTGTLAAPGVVGALAMAEGSRARFRGNEFALSHAVLEFTSRNRLEMAMDVHGQSQVRDYQIFMHAFGPLADPQLTLTSAPPLSQPDIITLLSLGFTRRDAAAGTGAVQGVATAAAAQALFSASGLDEQVRRFLPRSSMVRDLSVRITSEWSEASGQVEPRAEFESFLLRERLRLRYQAPLSGARGQKAQAELRLGGHTAVQYQWDPDNLDVPTGDHGVDLKLRWEWADE